MPTGVRAYAAVVTAFDSFGRLDSVAQRHHFRRLAAAGLSAFVGSSGAGEGYTLSDHERQELLRIAREEFKQPNRFVFMAPEARSAQDTIRMCELARPYRPDLIQVHGVEFGHGTRATHAEVEAYLREIFSAIDMPCSICNQPQMNGFEVSVPLLESLVRDHPQLVGLLDTSGDIRYMAAIRATFGDRLEVTTTLDAAIALLAIGGHGYTSGEANVVPVLSASLVTAFAAGNYERAFGDFQLLLAVSRVIRSVPTSGYGGPLGRNSGIGSPVPAYKSALRLFGLPGGGGVRRPRLPLNGDLEERLLAALKALDIPELTRLGGLRQS